MFRLVCCMLSFGLSVMLFAEPWLAIRYAQNCAGCHAPGRINLPPIDRRCTLSCQGCHVNPNGGGLRSYYGKWNEDRWLRSFAFKELKHASSFAPVKGQRYAKKLKQTQRTKNFIINIGHPLVKGKELLMTDEKPYARDGLEFVTAKDSFEFRQQIPQDDPYRLLDENKIDAGADFRYQFLRHLTDNDKERVEQLEESGLEVKAFWMTADFALQWRPVHRHLHLVYETQLRGYPNKDKVIDLPRSQWNRSLYLMVDDLPYNIFVMYGLYRPLFGGNPTADHRLLPQELVATALHKGKAYNLRYRAVTIGTAPNVPYANFHLITGDNDKIFFNPSDEEAKKDNGLFGGATNIGLRFVTLGINTTYSFWYTKDDNDNLSIMHSASFGLQVLNITAMVEGMYLHRENAEREDSGSVVHLDTYVRIWRQIYLNAQYAYANVSKTMKKGSAQQYRAGLRAFLLPGIDLSVTFEYDINNGYNDEEQKVEDKTSAISSQLHVML